MTATKHTPGPWVAIDHEIFADNQSRNIADVWISFANIEDEEAKANARLIAAAPDLLEALEAFAEYAEKGTWGSLDPVTQARAAIAKAKGDPS
jgi:hypothetical protein